MTTPTPTPTPSPGPGPAPTVVAVSDGTRPRTHRALLELEVPGGPDFDDPRHEWRRLFSDLLGTFFLVVVGAGGGVVGGASHGAIERGAAVVAPALTVMAIILFRGAVSGAPLNPAVTIAFAA